MLLYKHLHSFSYLLTNCQSYYIEMIIHTQSYSVLYVFTCSIEIYIRKPIIPRSLANKITENKHNAICYSHIPRKLSSLAYNQYVLYAGDKGSIVNIFRSRDARQGQEDPSQYEVWPRCSVI